MDWDAPLVTDTGMVVDLCKHAVDQMIARNVYMDEVRQTLADPDDVVDGSNDGEYRLVYRRYDIAVVIAPERASVVTVLYWLNRPWKTSDGRPSGTVLSATHRRRLVAKSRYLRRQHARAARVSVPLSVDQLDGGLAAA